MLVCVFSTHFAHGTADAARIRHSPRPRKGGRLFNASGATRREDERVFRRHCEERKRRSNPAFFITSQEAGLLRFARNDELKATARWARAPAPTDISKAISQLICPTDRHFNGRFALL
jgi:hypothetical protein